MILEKVVRVSELHLALAKRAPELAANLAPWVKGSRFVVVQPKAERETADYRTSVAATRDVKREETHAILASRVKGDLAQVGAASFIDRARTDMFKAEIDASLSAELR